MCILFQWTIREDFGLYDNLTPINLIPFDLSLNYFDNFFESVLIE